METVKNNNIPPINSPAFSIGDFVGFNNNVYFGYIFGIGMIGYHNYHFDWYYEILPIISIANKISRKKLLTEKELSLVFSYEKIPIEPNFSDYDIGKIVKDEKGITRIITDIELHWQANFKRLLKEKTPLPSIYSYRLKTWNSNERKLSNANVILLTPIAEYY